MSATVPRLARPGTQPSLAHEPNATRKADLRRSSRAISAFSLLRIPPEKRVRSIDPSGIASTSAYLASMTAGQNTMSKASATSRIASLRLRTLMSQPPQAGGPVHGKPMAAGGGHAWDLLEGQTGSGFNTSAPELGHGSLVEADLRQAPPAERPEWPRSSTIRVNSAASCWPSAALA